MGEGWLNLGLQRCRWKSGQQTTAGLHHGGISEAVCQQRGLSPLASPASLLACLNSSHTTIPLGTYPCSVHLKGFPLLPEQ